MVRTWPKSQSSFSVIDRPAPPASVLANDRRAGYQGESTMIADVKQFTLFQGLTQREVDAVARLCERATCKKGDCLFSVGERALFLYLLRSGGVELRMTAKSYNADVEIPLDIKSEGETFGWSAIASPYKYTLSAYATDDCDLWQINQADIEKLCEENSHLGYVFMKNTVRTIGQRYQLAREMLIKELQHTEEQRKW